MVRPLEALADAIISVTSWNNPESDAYQNRNPGNLRAFSPKHARDAQQRRVFLSALDGYQSLLFDLQVKCSGKSRTRLNSASSLRELMLSYGQPDTAAIYVAKFLKRALHNPDISDKTTLAYFLQEAQ